MLSRSTFGKVINLGYQRLSGISAATALTVPVSAKIAFIKCEAQNVRWRDDGINPTATIGMIMLPADEILVYTGNINSLRFIETTASGLVNISYYG